MPTFPFLLPQRRPDAWLGLALITLLLASLSSLLLASAAMAADFSWSGEGLPSANTWSNGANWTGGIAPTAASSIGTLTFPVLNRSACNSEPPTEACFTAVNDLSSLSVNELQIDDADSYALSGDGFTLGSGGLSTTNFAGSGGFATIATPITLGANQTWNVSGSPSGGDGLRVIGTLSGASAALTVSLSESGILGIGAYGQPSVDDEVGDITITTAGQRSLVDLFDNLNATDGHTVSVHDVELEIKESISLGQFSSSDSVVTLRGPYDKAVTPTVAGATFDAATLLDFPIEGSGTQAGTDYSQLRSTGTVDLGEVGLILAREIKGQCSTPPPGSIYTLLSTTGTLTGTFSNLPNGSTYTIVCGGEEQQYRLNYNTTRSPQTVTATAIASGGGGGVPANTQPPTIVGSLVEGQTLSESQGSWSNSPTSYSYQWQRCDVGGNNCQAILGATAQTYTLTAADVGSSIRVQEVASNSEGPSTPEVSASTAMVQAATAHGSVGASGGSSTGSSLSGNTTATISAVQIAALLESQLIPSGKAAKIGALLKHDGLTMSFTALEAGRLSVQWYVMPSGGKIAKHGKAKAVLVASGQASFMGAGTSTVKIRLTAAGKKLLKHSSKVKVEVKGVFTQKGEAGVSATKGFVLRG